MQIEMIEIVDYSGTSPEVAARVYFSSGHGLTCDNAVFAENLAEEGVLAPPGILFYPKDGRKFFDGLKFAFSGSYLRALPAVSVSQQKGEVIPQK